MDNMDIIIDNNGRIYCEGDMDYSFRSFDGALQFGSANAQAIFIDDCRLAFNSSSVGDGEKYSSGSTNFIKGLHINRLVYSSIIYYRNV